MQISKSTRHQARSTKETPSTRHQRGRRDAGNYLGFAIWSLGFGALFLLCGSLPAADKKIVLVAGTPSHGPGEHEHRAGCLLLKKCLDQAGGISSIVYSNGWPKDPHAFESADAILIYSDGGNGHPAIQQDHLKVLGDLMN